MTDRNTGWGDDDVTAVAYSMQAAYRNNNKFGEAATEVHDKHTGVSLDMLEAMWKAIDAYEDMKNE